MNEKNYVAAMGHINIIIAELNKVAAAVGHVSFDAFVAQEKAKPCVTDL